MKKLLSLVLVLACALCLVACAAGDIDNTNPQTETTKNTYMVEIIDNYPIENTLKSEGVKIGESYWNDNLKAYIIPVVL
jgi:ABC-type glycerol-3-phosphate transport system substrate-binding protein